MAGKVSPDHHLKPDRLAKNTNGDIRVRHGKLPVGDNVPCGIQEISGKLIENLTLIRYRLRQNMVKSRDPVSGYSHHDIIDIIDIPDLPFIKSGLPR
jgi:hypothetical protein